jgi:type I restriction enzyme M protein
LKKFDVVLANPPFGEDRSFVPKDNKDSEWYNATNFGTCTNKGEEPAEEQKKKAENKPVK